MDRATGKSTGRADHTNAGQDTSENGLIYTRLANDFMHILETNFPSQMQNIILRTKP